MAEQEKAYPHLMKKTHDTVLRIKRQTGLPIPTIYDMAVGYWESKRLKKFVQTLACAASETGK
jgi:hypothetical protein